MSYWKTKKLENIGNVDLKKSSIKQLELALEHNKFGYRYRFDMYVKKDLETLTYILIVFGIFTIFPSNDTFLKFGTMIFISALFLVPRLIERKREVKECK